MKRNIHVMTRVPTWKQKLNDSPVLTAKPDDKGYLTNYLDGIFPDGRKAIMPEGKYYEMFNTSKDNELTSKNVARNVIPPKACDVSSSSILAYNFFHWICPEHPFLFSDGIFYDKVYFDVKMNTLRKSNSRTNMKVMLVSIDCHNILCFESLLSEYTEYGAATFAKEYTKRENYYNNHFEDDFICYFKNNQNKDLEYNEGIIQMVKNLIAITSLQQSNYAMTDMLALNSYIEPEVAQRVQNAHLNIKFSNLLYLLRDDNAFVPISKTLRYIKLLADFRSSSSINDMVWQYFVLPNYYYTYSDLLAIMRSQMPDGLEEYLVKRYPDLYSFDDTTCPVIRV